MTDGIIRGQYLIFTLILGPFCTFSQGRTLVPVVCNLRRVGRGDSGFAGTRGDSV